MWMCTKLGGCGTIGCMQEHFWEERGIYYRTNDLRPDRTTLLFIHGLLGSSSAWRRFEEVFDASYNLLGVDLRGYGLSRKPNTYESYEIEKIASDVADLIDNLGITSFIPISHSAGTLIAVAECMACEDAVPRIILKRVFM